MLRWITELFSVTGLCVGLVACTGNRVLDTSHDPSALTPAMCASLHWKLVAPEVWVLYGHESNSTPANEGRTSNMLFARENTGAKGAHARGWLIGSGPSQRMGQLIRCSLEQQLGAGVTDVVSPRAHPESVLGASAFPDAAHLALPPVAVAMQQRCTRCSLQLAETVSDARIKQQIIAIPSQVIPAPVLTEASSSGDLGGLALGPFQVWSIPLDIEEWTTLIKHRASGVWFAPGLVWAAGLVPEVRDANVYQVIAALQAFEKISPLHVIPEQGQAGDAFQVQANTNYWRRLEVHTALAQSRGLADANALETPASQSMLITQGGMHDTLNRNRHGINRQRVWRQLEKIYFDAPMR